MAKKKKGSRGGSSGSGAAPKNGAPSGKSSERTSSPDVEEKTASAAATKSTPAPAKPSDAPGKQEPAAATESEAQTPAPSPSSPPADDDAANESPSAAAAEQGPDDGGDGDEGDDDAGAEDLSRARSLHSGPDLGAGKGAAWALPLVKIDKGWTWFESRLLVFVLLSLVAAMVSWVGLKGMHPPVVRDAQGSATTSFMEAGTAFRALLGFGVLGGLSRLVTRKMPDRTRNLATGVAIAVGVLAAPLWRTKGIDYAEHVLNWLQEGSSLTMFGGLRGVSSNLTILLALLGASLAAGAGRHINIDVLLRFLTPPVRRVVFVLSTIATVTVCFTVSWAFLDEISVTEFGADIDGSAGGHIDQVMKSVRTDLFVWRKQMLLDASAIPHVLGGGGWDDASRMNGRQWNAFVEDGGFRDHYSKEDVDKLLAPPDALDAPRAPMVVTPDGSPRGLLVRTMHLMFTFGLAIIGLRFLLRMLLVLSGHASVEPEPEDFESAKTVGKQVEALAGGAGLPGGEPADDHPGDDKETT